MVVLEKPVGLTLAADPRTGQVVVQDIKPNSPAHKCGLIQVGDVVKSCSAVFGDDMWAAGDIRRVRWAINSRCGDVRLILERSRRGGAGQGGVTAWYCSGKAGVASREREGTQLPFSFNSPGTDDSALLLELPGPGRVVQVAFHRNPVTTPPPSRRAAAAAAARGGALQRLRRELGEARSMPRLDLASGAGAGAAMHARHGGPDSFMMPPTSSAPGMAAKAVGGSGSGGGSRPGGAAASPSGSTVGPSSSGGGGSRGSPFGEGPPPPPPMVDVVAPPPPSTSSGGGGGGGLMSMLKLGGSSSVAAAAAAAAASEATTPSGGPKDRRVVSFLPWLLVSCGRLEHRHLAAIASARSLGALMELSLTRSQPPPPPPPSPPPAGDTAARPASAPAPSAASAAALTSAAPSPSSPAAAASAQGGYLIVRGSDLVSAAGDIGRVSYPALLAAATAASTSKPGAAAPSPPPPPPPPAGEAPPPPPPESAAAAAAAMKGSADMDSAAAAAAAAAVAAASAAAAKRAAANNGTGGASGGSASANGAGVGSNSNSTGSNGLGSSTLAFLNRSIFVNLRPNMTAVAAPGWPTSPGGTSATPAAAAAAAPPTPPVPHRFDPARVRHLLSAAASLQRLAFRRGGRLARGGARRDGCAVLLHCEEGMEADVAVLLAGWLHWFRRLPLQEAILAAETAMGTSVDQALLEAGTGALLAGARERSSRMVLTWKYGGLSAHVAGDVVASWGARVPMVRCRSPLGCKGDTHPGHFYLEVVGLRPGVYYYKYIVDGTWTVDSLAPKVLDAAGNWNNVLVVPEPPQVLTSREGLQLARWQAARLALEAKMGLSGPGGLQRPM
ncbi:hypothetical protein GPECTOR_10g807 [Gonium pectorale]|uniref:PDZ domain-containing protein n=1 Tax=Gonium pectorale TaxID=33097 RepID=A0A150GR10_GONPE|nr:hypothetical protein GPECTOR_10g807 [Gonium pectorale]|eukprot:KXZ52178.1 hypothetical protein GPECTOR_10g807 [Gonium pectorale]